MDKTMKKLENVTRGVLAQALYERVGFSFPGIRIRRGTFRA